MMIVQNELLKASALAYLVQWSRWLEQFRRGRQRAPPEGQLDRVPPPGLQIQGRPRHVEQRKNHMANVLCRLQKKKGHNRNPRQVNLPCVCTQRGKHHPPGRGPTGRRTVSYPGRPEHTVHTCNGPATQSIKPLSLQSTQQCRLEEEIKVSSHFPEQKSKNANILRV